MTPTSPPSPAPQPTAQERLALDAYEAAPMADGDAVLLLDETVALELEGLAAQWEPDDAPLLVDALGRAERVVLAIARRGSDLTTSDHALGAMLRRELEPAGIAMLPVQALPAA